jgi:hypothetical protein
MGINNFSSVFEKKGPFSLADLRTKSFAIDVYNMLFMNFSLQHTAQLTDPEGNPTLHIVSTLKIALKLLKLGIKTVWCFDSRDPRNMDDPKMTTIEKRRAIRERNLEEIRKLETEIEEFQNLAQRFSHEQLLKLDATYDVTFQEKKDKLEILRSRNPETQQFSQFVQDVEFMLTKLGLSYAVAPVGIDAEQLGAQLCIEKQVDGVMTSDPDALVYGAPFIVKKVPKQTDKYDIYNRKDCLKQYDITSRQFAEIAVALGCDFAPKVPGVGKSTVVRRVKNGEIEFNDEQKRAIKLFLKKSKPGEIKTNTRTADSINELIDWLVVKKGFKKDRLVKSMEFLLS